MLVRFLLLFASVGPSTAFNYFEAVIVIFTFAAILVFYYILCDGCAVFLPHSVAVIVVFLLSIVILEALQ